VQESRTVQAVPGRTAVAEDTLEVGPAGIPAVGSPGEDDLVGVALPSLLAAAVDIGLLVVVHILQEEGQVSLGRLLAERLRPQVIGMSLLSRHMEHYSQPCWGGYPPGCWL
jgi:hypothetical protein